MQTVAYLTMDNCADFYVYDALTYPPLQKLGIAVEEVSWRAPNSDWRRFAAVIVRSTWDYQQDPEQFLSSLGQIERSGTTLLNSLRTISWNLDKRYLQALEAQGVAIVPTYWFTQLHRAPLLDAFSAFGTDTLVVKPTISANADDTFRLNKTALSLEYPRLKRVFANRAGMIQPYLQNIEKEGEYSLFYFGGEYSHCIRKTPQAGDFRVQEEHGGNLHSVQADRQLRDAADKVLKVLPEVPLYARIDFIRYGRQVLVMEVELIEPSLYFNMDAEAAAHFARVLARRINNQGSFV